MIKTEFGFKLEVPLPFESTIIKVLQYLNKTGFDVFSNLDTTITPNATLMEEKGRKKVLSVFNPSLIDPNTDNDNVIYATSRIIIKELDFERTQVFVYDPMMIIGMNNDNMDIQNIAGKAQARLSAAFFNLSVECNCSV